MPRALDYVATKLRQLVRRFSGAPATYIVEVDDNFHYLDESERYTLGKFATAESAQAAAQALVDDYLESIHKEGMTADEMYRNYTGFGEDPHIVGVDFSAWDYARERCQVLCKR